MGQTVRSFEKHAVAQRDDRHGSEDADAPAPRGDRRSLGIVVAEFGAKRLVRQRVDRQRNAQRDRQQHQPQEQRGIADPRRQREDEIEGHDDRHQASDHERYSPAVSRTPTVRKRTDQGFHGCVDHESGAQRDSREPSRQSANRRYVEQHEDVQHAADDQLDQLTRGVAHLARAAATCRRVCPRHSPAWTVWGVRSVRRARFLEHRIEDRKRALGGGRLFDHPVLLPDVRQCAPLIRNDRWRERYAVLRAPRPIHSARGSFPSVMSRPRDLLRHDRNECARGGLRLPPAARRTTQRRERERIEVRRSSRTGGRSGTTWRV